MRMYLHQLRLHRSWNSTKCYSDFVPLAWYKQAGGAMSNPVTKDDWIWKKSIMMPGDCWHTPPTVPRLPPQGSQVQSETSVQAQVRSKTFVRLALYFTTAKVLLCVVTKMDPEIHIFFVIQLSELADFQTGTVRIQPFNFIAFITWCSDCRGVSV